MNNQITLQQATNNAKEAVAIQQELSKPVYPDQPAEPTVLERIAAFFTGKKSAALLREEIELEESRLRGLDDRASAKKARTARSLHGGACRGSTLARYRGG